MPSCGWSCVPTALVTRIRHISSGARNGFPFGVQGDKRWPSAEQIQDGFALKQDEA
jgi:hypothetical protein